MNTEESLEQFGLVPSDEALPRIRALLAREADAERHGRPRVDDLALLCCVQLFSRGIEEDVLRVWDARQSGFDLACYIDVQLLCGAGLEETKRFLSTQTSVNALQALAYLDKCEKARDFAEFSIQGYLDEKPRYFGQ
jgi:hypothetical protein